MELRVLQYFLAVAREQSITGAAEALHLSQPTLSRQLREMEQELGKPLFLRGSRRITLTEEGMLLRKRAEEILDLVRRTQNEIALADEYIAGDILVGAAETDGVRFLAQAAQSLRSSYPDIHLHIVSGDKAAVTEDLDRGLIDFGLVFGETDDTRYDRLAVPYQDHFGILMRRDAPLADRTSIDAADLFGQPLIVSRQTVHDQTYHTILGCTRDQLNVVATYSLLYNGSIMVEEGLGYALCLDKIINTAGSNLCFKPLTHTSAVGMHVIWKKYQPFTKAAARFLAQMQTLAAPSRTNQ